MAKTPRGKHHEREGAKDFLRIFGKAGVTRKQLKDSAKAAEQKKRGKS